MRALLIFGVAAIATTSVLASPNADDGKSLYRMYCAQCHGVNGGGNGVNAAKLSVQPRNHTDRAEMMARTDDELFKAIKEGGQAVNKSVLMPNWDGNLSDNEIRNVIAYMRQLCCEKQEK